jgi:nitronate monooxygenase
MLRTRLSKLLGIEFPIFSAQMGPDLTGPDLVAAVSGAGGLGLMQAQLSPPADFREQIQRVRKGLRTLNDAGGYPQSIPRIQFARLTGA